MKTLALYLSVIVLFLCLADCYLEQPQFDGASCSADCIIIEGLVLDTIANNPIQDVKITIENTDYGFYSIESVVVITHTDKDGVFLLNFPVNTYAEDGSYFIIKVEKDDYSSEGTSFEVDSTDIDKPIDFKFKLIEYTDISLHFENKSSQNLSNFHYYCGTCESKTNIATSLARDLSL